MPVLVSGSAQRRRRVGPIDTMAPLCCVALTILVCAEADCAFPQNAVIYSYPVPPTYLLSLCTYRRLLEGLLVCRRGFNFFYNNATRDM